MSGVAHMIGPQDGRYTLIALTGYTAFFDATYQRTPQGGHTVVAGYLSTVEQWEYWETNWKLVLAEFDVPYFHMNEFLGYREAFKDRKWRSNSYRARFISQLVAVTTEWTEASFGALLQHAVFDFHNNFYELEETFNPYALCGRDCAIRVRNLVRDELKSELPISYVFEKGDKGNGMLITGMQSAGLPSPIFKRPRPDSKKPQLDIDDPPSIPLQACDLAAYEIGRGQIDHKSGKKLRESLWALGQIKNRRWVEIKESDLMTRIQNAKICLRAAWKYLESPLNCLEPRIFPIAPPSKGKQRPQRKKET